MLPLYEASWNMMQTSIILHHAAGVADASLAMRAQREVVVKPKHRQTSASAQRRSLNAPILKGVVPILT